MSSAENQTNAPGNNSKERELLQALTNEIEIVMFHSSKDEAVYRGSCIEALFNVFMSSKEYLEGTSSDVSE